MSWKFPRASTSIRMRQKLLALIRMASVRMGGLVDDVLAYSRCLDHQAPLGRVDLNGVLHDILEDLRFDIIRSGATITMADVPSIMGDPMQVALFQNPISNAIKYCSPGRPPRVLITAKIQPTRVRVTVSDNGISIAPQHFERIFTLFQRLHTYDTYPGSGIGLALCKRIAANLGGELSLTSRQRCRKLLFHCVEKDGETRICADNPNSNVDR
ncbi:ATP-binding protein [Novosphingobium sp. MW5]|nr:ATP-binding protein [Novosphingobium sp. MW5]